MSPELETLDQLLGGDLSLKVVKQLFDDTDAFEEGVLGLLKSGDVELIAPAAGAVPQWQWQQVLSEGRSSECNLLHLKITSQGVKRIK